MKKRIKYGTVVLLCLITSLIIYGVFYDISDDSPVAAKADIKISAYDLITVADRDDSLFNRQYLSKVLSVGGIIKGIIRDDSGNYMISLGVNPGIPSSVRCSLDSEYKHHTLSLSAGDSCSIRGTCAGHLSDIILVQCIVEK